MDILVLCHYGLYQDRSTSFVHAQTKALAAQGHRVRVIVPIACGKRDEKGRRFFPTLSTETADGVELYYLRYLSLSGYGEGGFNQKRAAKAIGRKLATVLRDFSPALLHAHTLGFDSQVGGALKDRLSCPLVVTSHGSDASVPYEKGERENLREWCDQADQIVAVSSALAAKIRDCGTKTPVQVILNGFRTEHLPDKTEKIPETFVQVGHLTHQKRVHVTVQAFAEIAKQRPDARLTLIGHGPAREELETLCHTLGVADKVTFTGQIPNAQVLAHLASSQFFVMPSVREGFGIVYAEAMACGCVTVGTKGEGIADLIRDGENGFLVEADRPEEIVAVVRECLQRPEIADKIAEAGCRDAKELTWAANAEAYTRLFEQIALS